MTRLFEPVRYAVARWRLRRVMRPIDRQISAARRKHKPVAHLMAAKRAVIHSALASRP
jgi:hypothetical protein